MSNATLPEYVGGLPNLCGSEDLIAASCSLYFLNCPCPFRAANDSNQTNFRWPCRIVNSWAYDS